jgi:ribosome biogenesis SPOUT family RNA methylase Rps3
MKYIVEHMEEGFSDWVRLEYLSIAQEVGPGNFYLSSVPENADIPPEFTSAGIKITGKDVVNFAEIEPEFDPKRVVLLDPAANSDLSPEEADKFDFFLFGGILGDHPPRDRTGELRKYGFVGRRLGPVQLTTDTAVRVTQLVVEDASK